MADRPAVLTRSPIARAKLYAVFKTEELVRAFESLLEDIGSVLPDSVEAAQESAQDAQITADQALALVTAALESLELASSQEAQIIVLQAELDELRKRVAGLEQGYYA